MIWRRREAGSDPAPHSRSRQTSTKQAKAVTAPVSGPSTGQDSKGKDGRRRDRPVGRVVDRPAGKGSERAASGRPRARLVGALVASVLCVGVLFVAVFPTRSYLAQRASVHQAQRRIDAIDRENQRLQRQARRLTTPDEIERLARAQYGLVRPGEQAYAILPAPKASIGLPELWPFTGLERLLATR